MLSYRHAFHAGNHADILKHYTLSLILDYYNQKEKPYCVIDTHAGAGLYKLSDNFPQKNKEFESGILRLQSAKQLPESLAKFVALVQSFNTKNQVKLYPGSPKVSSFYLRASDQLHLFELHPSDYKILSDNFSHRKQAKTYLYDGFNGIKSVLPPSTKRGVTIIDPSYESKEDYLHVVDAIKNSLKLFATGTYLIWYPLLPKPEPLQMINNLRKIPMDNWLDVRLTITAPSKTGYGMHGSGLFIINPPWILPKILENTLPYLSDLLAQDNNAQYQINSQIS